MSGYALLPAVKSATETAVDQQSLTPVFLRGITYYPTTDAVLIESLQSKARMIYVDDAGWGGGSQETRTSPKLFLLRDSFLRERPLNWALPVPGSLGRVLHEMKKVAGVGMVGAGCRLCRARARLVTGPVPAPRPPSWSKRC